jgi:hypothetical protein
MTVDYLYPHKTPYTVKFETDTWILLLDLNDESAASIMDSADWVIASLRIYRGTLKKKIYFEDSVEGLLELKHNGDELEKIIPCTADHRQSIEHLINRGKSPT